MRDLPLHAFNDWLVEVEPIKVNACKSECFLLDNEAKYHYYPLGVVKLVECKLQATEDCVTSRGKSLLQNEANREKDGLEVARDGFLAAFLDPAVLEVPRFL